MKKAQTSSQKVPSHLVGLAVDQVGKRGAGDLAGSRLRQSSDKKHSPEGGHRSDGVSHELHHLVHDLLFGFLHTWDAHVAFNATRNTDTQSSRCICRASPFLSTHRAKGTTPFRLSSRPTTAQSPTAGCSSTDCKTHTRIYACMMTPQRRVMKTRLWTFSYLLQCSSRQPVARHVDDIVWPGHDVKETLVVHESCVHGVVVTLRVEQRWMSASC